MRTVIVVSTALAMGLMTACSVFNVGTGSLPAGHPEKLPDGRPICSGCHRGQVKAAMKPYDGFDHTPQFITDHRFPAGRDGQLCALCHAQSFCTDCHTNRNEVKPSVKLGDRADRDLPHRGDYLSRHQIDGRIDPTGCYRCHGRANNSRCVACHRQ